jgi:RNA polymerase sigma factor (sigma-70 family)
MSADSLHLVLHHLRRLSPTGGGKLSDAQLLAGYVASRDEAAFATLVRRHGPMVFALARRMLRDAHAAEDVFQATFLVLASTARTIRRRGSVSSWLYGVAHRLAARARLAGRRWEIDARNGIAMSQQQPDAALTQRELETALDEGLKELADRYRAPLVLCYLEGQTQDEAARRLGWSKATLRRRLERGRELLRARLLRRGVSLSLGLLTAALAASAEAGALPLPLQQAALASFRGAGGAGAGAVSPTAASLAQWGVQTMLATRKLVLGWLLVAVLAVSGAAAHALARPRHDGATAVEPGAGPAAGPPAARVKKPLGSVWSVAWSPDGRTLATGSGNADSAGTLALWDVPAGKARLALELPRGIRCVTFSPDGKRVAAAGWDNVARLFDVRTGKLQATLRGHTAAVNGLAFSPDGKVLASCSLDKSIYLWGAGTGAELRRLTGHQDWVLSVAFFPDGKSLASAGKDATVRVWDVASGRQSKVLRQPGVPAESVTSSPDGKLLASGGWDCAVRLWDAEAGTQRALLRGHTLGVLFVAFSPDGKALASASGNFNRAVGGEVKLWRVPTGEDLGTLKGHTNSIWAARFAPDGRALATAGRDQTVKLWEVATRQERRTLEDAGDTADAKRAAPLTEKERDAIWAALAAPEAAPAGRALGRLAAAPGQAVPWLAERLKPGEKADGPQEKRVRGLIVRLDDDNFATRERATEELEKLGAAAGPALRQALDKAPSAEMRLRIDRLLGKLGKPATDPEKLRTLRAVEALELIGTPEARRLLQQLAAGPPEALLTQEAAASSRRLAKRP